MSSSQNSASVLVQHSPPPPHALTSPFSPETIPEHPPQIQPIPASNEEDPSQPTQAETERTMPSQESSDTLMVDAPPTETEQDPHLEQPAVSVAEEPQTQPDATTPPTPETVLGPPPTTETTAPVVAAEIPEPDLDPDAMTIPPPPSDSRNDIPEWVLFEEDVSKPSAEEEEELKLRDSRGTELSARDVSSVEKRLYSDVDDPDMRPIKKLRLSWLIKGVRGTKDKPNHARVMVSPPAFVDGNYWQIKFYPRGNRASSYSAYIKCSRKPPSTEREPADSTFSFFDGPPDADLGEGAVPTQTLKTEPIAKITKRSASTCSATSSASQKQESSQSSDTANPLAPEAESNQPHNEQNAPKPVVEEWRVSAQLGVIMYNPGEPRTCAYTSSEHQFSRHTDDWGWSNVVGPWRDVHLRQHLQRKPLLQNDTIAIDAYIRIFDDPTKALWWRPSDGEPQWDSKTLAGYFPMGTPPLFHSPAVAGMTALLILAPFRKFLQEVDVGAWRRDSQVRSRPLIAQLQIILFLMRTLKKERETYVELYPAIQAMRDLGEEYTDVKTFWEAFRRSIELELDGDDESLNKLRKIFDTPDGPLSLPPLPVENVLDVQQTLTRVLQEKPFNGRLPDFLPLMLGRDKFDIKTREWKLLYDRVILNDELDLSDFTSEIEHAKYTLYGFMVHAGARNSGKFYTVLRPNGPKSMWLAFEDGDGNQVFSYSRKGIETFEGLEGQPLKDFSSTRSTAYMAMYVRTTRLSDYLPTNVEPFKLAKWLAPHIESSYLGGPDIFAEDSMTEQPEEVSVEIYSDEGILGREGLLDWYKIRQKSRHKGLFHAMNLPSKATYQDLRQQLSKNLALEKPQMMRLFIMGCSSVGNFATAQMPDVNLKDSLGSSRAMGQPLCLWMSILKNKEELELFGEPDKPDAEVVMEQPQAGSESSAPETAANSAEDQNAAPDVEQASIEAAVTADIERVSSELPRSSAVAVEIDESDAPMQFEIPAPTAEESLNLGVPHGYLIDAAGHEDNAAATTSEGVQATSGALGLSPSEEAVIAAVMAEDAEVMDFVMNSGSASTDRSASQSSETSSQSSSPPPEKEVGPVDNTYGFIQVFDVDKQTFRVEGTFFAKTEEKMMEFLLKRLGYDADKQINVWRRHSTVDGAMVTSDETFRDCEFVNGSDLVVYDRIPENRITELQKEGKCINPRDLSKYLRMLERRHPTQARTTTDPVELAEFGTDYYKGPLVNGRYHGANCFSISSSGNIYQGPLVCDVKSGKVGKMTYCNGDTYEGEWYQDKRHGQGTFVEARTGNRYVGGFENGKRWGMGTTYWQVADEQADLCQICYGNEIDALFFDCGHVCACVECARQCDLCPICRKSVKQVVKMFRA